MAHLIQSDVTQVDLTICSFFFSSELAGGTPHTVRCNIKVGLSILSCCCFFLSELAGGTPHTVRCNVEVGLTICSFFFFYLNWQVAHLIRSDIT